MQKKTSWYLKCKPADLAAYVVLVGDPARVKMFGEQMQAARIVAQEREFTTLTGTYQGLRVSVISIGIGAPSAAIVLEEIWELGAEVVVRAGTGLTMNIELGQFLLAEGAVRMEGVSPTYLPIEFPAICDFDLYYAFRDVLRKHNQPYQSGLIATSDGFYTHIFHHGVAGKKPARVDQTFVAEMAGQGVIGTDMETSAVYTIGHYLKLKCLSLLLATVDGPSRTMMEQEPRQKMEYELAHMTLEGLLNYSKLNR